MPRTLAQNAQYIAETIKPAIKSAIEAQGVTVPSTDSFLDYADRIGEIEGGGSGYQLKDLPTCSISTVNDAAELPLNALKVSVKAQQDLHGYDHPWVGGAGKNKLPLPISEIKAANTSGTWSGNTYTYNGITFNFEESQDGYLTKIQALGICTGEINLRLFTGNIPLDTTYIANGVSGGDANTYLLEFIDFDYSRDYVVNGDIALTINSLFLVELTIRNGITVNNEIFRPMLRLATETDPTFEPYSNICPIEGWDSGEITVCDDIQNPTQTETYTQQFPQTIYGASWDVVGGVLSQTDGYIASYNGESLPSTWISDRDVYASGTTPTIGAEVVYKLATPTTIDLSPLSIRMLQGTNNLFADCGEVIEGEYFVDEGAHRYQLYDYIESDGTQCIDSGVKLNANDVVKCIYVPLSGMTNWNWLWIAEDTNTSKFSGVVFMSSSQMADYDYSVESNRRSWTANQISESSLTASAAINANVKFSDGAIVKLHSFSINDNFYLPAKRKSDGVFGLYDVTNQAFLTDSAGGNAFVGGNPIGVGV